VLDELGERWTALRAELGRSVDFALDLHGRFSAPASRRVLPRLEPLDPLFVEEPLPPELQRDLARVAASTSIPIATGERLYDRWEVSDVVDQGIAVLQPDVSHAYGISEVVRIAALADVHGVHLAPHCATGPLAFAACLQVDLAVQNVLIQECHLSLHAPGRHPAMRFVVGTPFDYADGYVAALTAPGLGVEVDEDAVRAAGGPPPGGGAAGGGGGAGAGRAGGARAARAPGGGGGGPAPPARGAAAPPRGGASPVWSLPDGSYAEW
jgi:galactonate dehydratase